MWKKERKKCSLSFPVSVKKKKKIFPKYIYIRDFATEAA